MLIAYNGRNKSNTLIILFMARKNHKNMCIRTASTHGQISDKTNQDGQEYIPVTKSRAKLMLRILPRNSVSFAKFKINLQNGVLGN